MDLLKLGRILWRRVIRPRLFAKDPEEAHRVAIRLLERFESSHLLRILGFLYRSPFSDMPTSVGGVRWRNPAGLAPGLTKDGRGIAALDALGFGAISIGTITPSPQPGSPPPRIFRHYDDHRGTLHLVNRYGIPSEGAMRISERVAAAHARHRIRASLIFSLGPNTATLEKSRGSAILDGLINDYSLAAAFLLPVIRGDDAIQVNISSPSMTRLHDFIPSLLDLLGTLRERLDQMMAALNNSPLSLILKISPDHQPKDYELIVKAAAASRFNAIEAFNTTTDMNIKSFYRLNEEGGVSGDALTALALRQTKTLAQIIQEAGAPLDLIASGGIMNIQDALMRRNAGAKAILLYTGLVKNGPPLIYDILTAWHATK